MNRSKQLRILARGIATLTKGLKAQVVANVREKPTAHKGTYVIVEHYISNNNFAARLESNPKWDDDVEAYTAYFIGEDGDKFWHSEAIYLGEGTWEVVDGGYAGGEKAKEPRNWRIPPNIRRRVKKRKK